MPVVPEIPFVPVIVPAALGVGMGASASTSSAGSKLVTTATNSSRRKSTVGRMTACCEKSISRWMISTTWPIGMPRGKLLPMPEVKTASPTLNSRLFGMKSISRLPPAEPRTTPSSRLSCKTTCTALVGSVSSSTLDCELLVTSVMRPTNP